MPALNGTELNLLGADGHKTRFFLSISNPRSLLAGQVNGTLSRGATSIPYDNGLGSGHADIAAGHTFKIQTAWGPEIVRIDSITGNQASGTVTIKANSIVSGDNNSFEALEDFPLLPKPPRFTSSIFYKDWNVTYTDENLKPPPVIITGPHRAKFLSGGSAVFAVDLTNSYAIAQGASMVAGSYSASVVPSSGATVSLTNGVGTITFTAAGQYWVTFSGTDSNGKTQITRRRYFVHDLDPDSADYPYTDFEIPTLQGDYERGGWVLGINVNGVADAASIPDEAFITLWCTVDYGGTEQYIGQPDGILFSGYIRKGSITANWEYGSVSFEAQTIEGVLRNIGMQTIPLQATRSPAEWYEYAHWLTNGRGLHHYWLHHSNLFEIADVFGLMDNTWGRAGMTFQKGDMYSQALNVIRDHGINAHIVSNKAGQIYVHQNVQLLNDSDRAAKPVIAALDKTYRQGTLTILENSPETAATVYASGIAYDGETAGAFCAKSPGDVPERSGAQFVDKPNQTANSQTQMNELAGRIDAQQNNPYPEVRVDFDGIWAGVLDVTEQEWYTISVASEDTPRGIVWADKKIVCRQVTNQVDPVNGYIASQTVFETEAEGPPGVLVNCIGLPDKPDPPAPAWDSELPALMAFSNTTSYRDDNDVDWSELANTPYNHGTIDPWWKIKTGNSNPEAVIWLACGDNGLVVRREGINGTLENLTPQNNPTNSWSEGQVISDLTMVQIVGDAWRKNRFYVLSEQQESANWRGWLLYSGDNCQSYTYVSLFSGSPPAQVKPLWMAVNRSRILVTVWNSTDGLNVIEYDPSDMSYVGVTNLGAATITEVIDRNYYAFPVTVYDDNATWYIAGRMVNPAGLVGTYHIIQTTNDVPPFSSFENGWSTDHCASLIVGSDDGVGNRDYWAARQPGLTG